MPPESQIGHIPNMDETPVRFELPATRTLEFTEKRSFTVALTVAADGKKFPPKVIFKDVRTPKDLEVPPQIQVSIHRKGRMDEEGE